MARITVEELFYYLAATANANGLNVEEYLAELCKKETLMPWIN